VNDHISALAVPPGDYAAEIDAWSAARLAALRAEDGWLHLTDRIEIAPGRYTLGQGGQNDLVISAGPDHLGVLVMTDAGQAQLERSLDQDQPRVLPFEPYPEAPPRLKIAGLLLEIMEVNGQRALRVRDLDLLRRKTFAPIPRFDIDPAWRIVAEWEALAARPLSVGLVTGAQTDVTITHCARFSHAGHQVTLLPTHWKGGKPMFVIRDATSGLQTYAASRFLIGQVTGDRVVLDFNMAFNPPCAFSDHAVCPLPPRENVLPFAICAGEMVPRPET
jgi:uncharacterized protein